MSEQESSKPAAGPRTVPVAAIFRAAKLAALGCLLIAANVATVIIGAWSANRPHEVKGEWVFTLLVGAHAVVCALVLWSLRAAWKFRRAGTLRPGHWCLILFASGYAGVVLYFLGLTGRDYLR